MSAIIILPSVYEPYLAPCAGSLASDVVDCLTVVDNTTRNLGVAASWNLGGQRVLAGEADWLVSLSAATRFGPSGGRDLLAHLAVSDAWVVESETPVGWHCIAWSRQLLETIGLFDENYWPAYGEDADWSWRVLVAMEEAGVHRWETFPTDAWITMRGHATALAGIEPNMARSIAYFEHKWGPKSWTNHVARWRRPFNRFVLDYWPEVTR